MLGEQAGTCVFLGRWAARPGGSGVTPSGSKQLGGWERSAVTPVAEGHGPLFMGGWLRSTPVPTGGRGWGTADSVTLQAWGAKTEPPSVLAPHRALSDAGASHSPCPDGWKTHPCHLGMGSDHVVSWHLGFKTSTSC